MSLEDERVRTVSTSMTTPTAMGISNQAGTFVPRVGLGCMGMSEFYGQRDDVESLNGLNAAFAVGYRHFDSADMYGAGHNEQLLGSFLRAMSATDRRETVIATKAGIRRVAGTVPSVVVDSTPRYLQQACDASLRRLGVETIDLYYLHRRSPTVPIEDSVGALADLMQAGKIRAIGLSEVSCDTLRRACEVAAITALQSEYSLWSRDVEGDILDACARGGVTLVAYSPLGRGFLSGTVTAERIATPGDLRQHLPRFEPGNFVKNQLLLAELEAVALEVSATAAQVALAWVLAQSQSIHVIPGSSKASHIRANRAALEVALTPAQLARLTRHFASTAVSGERYPDKLLSTVNV